MKKTTLTALVVISLLISNFTFAQSFEGKIVYQNTFKSKTPKITDDQLNTMMGSTEEQIIKGGNYKNSSNGTFMQWQLYVNADNKLYNKMSNNETIFWYDGSMRDDSVLSTKINKGVTDVLGYKCDELIFTSKKGTQKYYFNSKFSIDPSLFSKHLFGLWHDYLVAAKAVPLKMVIEDTQFTLTSTATEIKPMKIDDKELQLPAGAKTQKSPY